MCCATPFRFDATAVSSGLNMSGKTEFCTSNEDESALMSRKCEPRKVTLSINTFAANGTNGSANVLCIADIGKADFVCLRHGVNKTDSLPTWWTIGQSRIAARFIRHKRRIGNTGEPNSPECRSFSDEFAFNQQLPIFIEIDGSSRFNDELAIWRNPDV